MMLSCPHTRHPRPLSSCLHCLKKKRCVVLQHQPSGLVFVSLIDPFYNQLNTLFSPIMSIFSRNTLDQYMCKKLLSAIESKDLGLFGTQLKRTTKILSRNPVVLNKVMGALLAKWSVAPFEEIHTEGNPRSPLDYLGAPLPSTIPETMFIQLSNALHPLTLSDKTWVKMLTEDNTWGNLPFNHYLHVLSLMQEHTTTNHGLDSIIFFKYAEHSAAHLSSLSVPYHDKPQFTKQHLAQTSAKLMEMLSQKNINLFTPYHKSWDEAFTSVQLFTHVHSRFQMSLNSSRAIPKNPWTTVAQSFDADLLDGVVKANLSSLHPYDLEALLERFEPTHPQTLLEILNAGFDFRHPIGMVLRVDHVKTGTIHEAITALHAVKPIIAADLREAVAMKEAQEIEKVLGDELTSESSKSSVRRKM